MYPLNRYRFTQHPSPTYKITATFQDLIKLSIEKYILFMSCIAISSFTLIGQKSFGYLKNTSLEEKITTSVYQLYFYVKQFITSWNTIPIYSPIHINLHSQTFYLLSASILTLVILSIWTFKKKPYLLTLILCHTILLLPTLGLIQAGWITHADRWYYMANIPLIATITICIIKINIIS